MLSFQTFRENWKRYAWSSLVTFLAAFLIAIAPNIDSISLVDLGNGTLVGLGFIAIRAGVKALIEYLLSVLIKK